jgi:hypothetical protein
MCLRVRVGGWWKVQAPQGASSAPVQGKGARVGHQHLVSGGPNGGQGLGAPGRKLLHTEDVNADALRQAVARGDRWVGGVLRWGGGGTGRWTQESDMDIHSSGLSIRCRRVAGRQGTARCSTPRPRARRWTSLPPSFQVRTRTCPRPRGAGEGYLGRQSYSTPQPHRGTRQGTRTSTRTPTHPRKSTDGTLFGRECRRRRLCPPATETLGRGKCKCT